jgi:predicted lipase
LQTVRNVDTGGYAIVTINHEFQSIFVSYRGTSDFKNMITNLQIWYSVADWDEHEPVFMDSLFNTDNIKIHSGFERLYISIRNQILPPIYAAAMNYPDYKVVFTGHSLGGALATLSAVDFHQLLGFGNRISVYTYGQPRLGNTSWANYLDRLPFANRIYRLVKAGDPISHLPPSSFGYAHNRQQFQLDEENKVTKCENNPESGESLKCLEDFQMIRIRKHLEYFQFQDC